MSSIFHSRHHIAIRMAGLSLAATAALAVSPFAFAEQGADASAQARYQQERARCMSGESGQDYATCLREAGAALQAARRGQLDDGDAKYRRNALERCKPLPADEAKDCRDRIMGQGTVSGSVKGGGIYREKTTIETKVIEPTEPAK
jgi:hypothetical protein